MTKTELEALDQRLIDIQRRAEFELAKLNAKSSLEDYWAGSATASLIRDYRAGRVVTIKTSR